MKLHRILFCISFAVGFIGAALLDGCAAVQQSNPQAQVYQIKETYGIALNGVIAYDSLPACESQPKGTKALCSTSAGTRALKVAVDQASAAINAAETAVRAPGATGSSVQNYLTLADQAVNALIAAITQLQGK